MDWQIRLIEEYDELCKRILKLMHALDSPGEFGLTMEQVHDMSAQLTAMKQYAEALNVRIAKIIWPK